MIYIATHKSFVVPSLPGYVPVHVGSFDKPDLGYQRDSDGDNISVKNPNFCELTALYWAWKNSTEPYKGLVHYRRYFGKSNLSASLANVFSHDEMVGFLKNADIVLPYVENLKQDAKSEILINCCTPEIFHKLRSSVLRLSPEYIPSFDAFFSGNKSTLFNMMFCSSAIYDDYCAWLFGVLFDLERNVDMSGLSPYQQRLYGFLSERLLNVYVRHHHLVAHHTPVVNTEMPLVERLALLRRRVTNEFFFRLRR